MYLLEGLMVAVTVALLFATTTNWLPRRVGPALIAIGVAISATALLVGQARIHMVPVFLVFLAASLFSLKRSRWHVALRAVGITLGLILATTSVALALALPVVSLPEPEGPYPVAVQSFNLVDESRDETFFDQPGRPREIYVQAWYPALLAENEPLPGVRGLWQELYRFPVFDVIFGYLSGIKTHSHPNLPLAIRDGPFPAIVFSPSIGGIAEQNTLLMEHLASNGYIVFGITHPRFGLISALSDGTGVSTDQRIGQTTSQQGSVDLGALESTAQEVTDPIARALVWLRYFEQGTMLNEFMEIWVPDIQLLLDAMQSPETDESAGSTLFGAIDTGRIGLLGMSYGGGAVTEVCKRDERCRAAINFDGGLWGRRTAEPTTVPHLVLASAGNSMFFEHGLLTSEAPYYLIVVDGATHVNFTDASAFLPVLDWLGITGPIDGDRVIRIMNVVASRFFDAYLRNEGPNRLDFSEFNELDVRTHAIE